MLLGNTSADGQDDGCCWRCIKIPPCCFYAGTVRARMWQMSLGVSHVILSQHVWNKCAWVVTHLSSSSYYFPPRHSKDLWGSQVKKNGGDRLKWRLMASVLLWELMTYQRRTNEGHHTNPDISKQRLWLSCYGLVHETHRLMPFSSLADRACKSCHLLYHIREDVPKRTGK